MALVILIVILLPSRLYSSFTPWRRDYSRELAKLAEAKRYYDDH